LVDGGAGAPAHGHGAAPWRPDAGADRVAHHAVARAAAS
jgi:hypothetical protein